MWRVFCDGDLVVLTKRRVFKNNASEASQDAISCLANVWCCCLMCIVFVLCVFCLSYVGGACIMLWVFCDRNFVVITTRRVFKQKARAKRARMLYYICSMWRGGHQHNCGRFLRPGRHKWPYSLLDSCVVITKRRVFNKKRERSEPGCCTVLV
jgi:hypothetical protein